MNQPPRKAKPGHHWVEVYGRGPNNHYWYEAKDPDDDFRCHYCEEVLVEGAKPNLEPQVLNDKWLIKLRAKDQDAK